MIKVPDIVELADHGFTGGDAAGRPYLMSGKLSDLDFSLKYILIINRFLDVHNDAVLRHGTHFLIAVSGRFVGDVDQTALFQLLDVTGESTVADIQLCRKLVPYSSARFQVKC